MRVFQTLIAFSGNAQPQLALTRRLIERGHEVRVLAHRAARERIEASGAEFVAFERALPELDLTQRDTDTLRDWEARTPIGARLRLLKNALFAFVGDVARDCADQLDAWPADVVAFDWMLTGAAIAAERASLPALALVHCPYPLSMRGAPPLFTGLAPMDGPLGALRDRLLGHASSRVLTRTGLPLLNRARAQHGLAPLRSWEAQMLGVRAIYMMTAPELDFSSRGELPENVSYVGPAFEPLTLEWRSPWPDASSDPLVVISFSTSYMNQQALAQRVLNAVAELPVRALLTAGPALEAASLRVPSNARTVAYVPHRAVLPHTALVVTHAGWQTINASLAEGVPLLCIPHGRDQPGNAARVVFAGAGVRVGKRASIRTLRREIAGALGNPQLKRGALAMADALAREDGALRIAQEIERLAT